jgi:predicted metal-binding membrane protein
VSALEALLRRERAVIAVGLAVLMLLAWIYIWRGAGMGMSALDMTMISLFPHAQAEPMPYMVMQPVAWAMVVAMWWVMMIAMMTSSAAPLLLLYARVMRHATAQEKAGVAYVPSMVLVIGYLTVWLAFSVIAAVLQYLLQRAGLISAMMLWSRSALLSSAVLIGAGVYQLSPLKRACLEHCRGPVEFLTRHWRPGWMGAFAMGVEHGLWCVGCCWMLMALLFVGGVMNLAWIAFLSLLVFAEKVIERGMIVGRIAGGVLIIWGVSTLAV